jgi:tRNA-dihydrouridine synthase
MATPLLAEKIIRGVVDNSQVPVTVKIRTGVNTAALNGEEFARMAESAGAAALTVHGRTWAQGFTGVSDRSMIARVKRAVKIPVIGNGDVNSYREAVAMMAETGCDGVMIGRAALGNPWVFTKKGRPAGLTGILDGAARHLELIEQFLETDRMLGTVKNHIGRYFKHLPGSAEVRKAVYDCPSFAALKATLHHLQKTTEPGPE